MSDFLKRSDRIQSILRGIQGDLREYRKSSKEFVRIHRALEQAEEDIRELNPLLNAETLSPLDYEERLKIVKDIEAKHEQLNQQLLSKQNQKEKSRNEYQDYTLDEILRTSLRLKGYSEQMNEELNCQNFELGNLEDKVTNTTLSFDFVREHFQSMVEKTSNSCLVWVSIVLGTILLLILIYS